MKVNQLLNVTLENLALGGPAVAHHEGRVVFVDRGIPGDRVEARVTRVKRSYAEARLTTIASASSLRVEPRCAHVSVCGGCRFQDLDYREQCRAKTSQVVEALRRLGGVADPPVSDIVPAPEPFGYRNKMEFSFHPEEGSGRCLLGLHVRGAYDRVFDVETCHLCSPLVNRVVSVTRAFARTHGWPPYHPRQHTGIVRFLTVRHLPHTSSCAVHLIAARDELPGLERWAAEVASLSPEIRTVTLALNARRANVAVGESERVLVGSGTVTERLLGLEFEAGLNAFLQTNSRQAEALYAAAIDAAGSARCALDLYCGTGTLTLLLARRCGQAIGVESVADAAIQARRNAERNAIANVSFVEGEARRVLRAWARGERPGAPRPDVVLVDPPRAGLHPRVVARVCELEPSRIVYVSCNPGTLARDVRDFGTRGWRPVAIRPFDMFPHTPHIECVTTLER